MDATQCTLLPIVVNCPWALSDFVFAIDRIAWLVRDMYGRSLLPDLVKFREVPPLSFSNPVDDEEYRRSVDVVQGRPCGFQEEGLRAPLGFKSSMGAGTR